MRFIFIIFLTIFKFEIAAANVKIAFIDLNFIINNSMVGTSIKTFINDLSKEKSNETRNVENSSSTFSKPTGRRKKKEKKKLPSSRFHYK